MRKIIISIVDTNCDYQPIKIELETDKTDKDIKTVLLDTENKFRQGIYQIEDIKDIIEGLGKKITIPHFKVKV